MVEETPKELRARCCGCNHLYPISTLTYICDRDGDVIGKQMRSCVSCLSNYPPCDICGKNFDTLNDFPSVNGGVMLVCNEHSDDVNFCDVHDAYYIGTRCTISSEHDEENIRPHRQTDVESGKKKYGTCRASGKTIISPRMFGIEFEIVPTTLGIKDIRKAHTNIAKSVPNYYGVTTDASLPEGSLEVQTAPASMKIGEDLVHKFINSVDKKLWTVSDRCGTHVHIDCNDIVGSFIRMKRLFSAFFVVDDILIATQPPNRRANRYCSPLSKDKAVVNRDHKFKKGFDMGEIIGLQSTLQLMHTIYKTNGEQLRRMMRDHMNEARYYGVNFHTLFDGRGTVENRYHMGTIDANEILMWVAFNQHIVDTSRLITPDVATKLYAITDVKNRLLEYAKVTKMKSNVLNYVIGRINKYK